MSRRMIALLALAVPALAGAREPPSEAVQGTPPERIDILADAARTPAEAAADERCLRDQQDASLRGEIVVCAPSQDQSQYRTVPPDEAQKRYARETLYAGDPQAPGVAGPGIFTGPATVSGLCLIPPCPPPPVVMIDLEAIPEAPAGSDADRVGRGLAPTGDEGELEPPAG